MLTDEMRDVVFDDLMDSDKEELVNWLMEILPESAIEEMYTNIKELQE